MALVIDRVMECTIPLHLAIHSRIITVFISSDDIQFNIIYWSNASKMHLSSVIEFIDLFTSCIRRVKCKLADDICQVSLIEWTPAYSLSHSQVCVQQCNIHNWWTSARTHTHRYAFHLCVHIHLDCGVIIFTCLVFCVQCTLAIRWLQTLFTVCHLAINQLPWWLILQILHSMLFPLYFRLAPYVDRISNATSYPCRCRCFCSFVIRQRWLLLVMTHLRKHENLLIWVIVWMDGWMDWSIVLFLNIVVKCTRWMASLWVLVRPFLETKQKNQRPSNKWMR